MAGCQRSSTELFLLPALGGRVGVGEGEEVVVDAT